MKKTVVLMAILVALTGLAWAEAEKVEPAEAAVVEATAACEAAAPRQSTEKQVELPKPLLVAEPVSSGIPECPEVKPCGGGGFACNGSNACGATGKSKIEDTGSSQCTRNGQVLACIFGTIHVKKTKCELCPCCFQNPACFCPIDPAVCGSAVQIVCQ